MVMEKLEKHIGETLKEREITPSKEAWKKIDAQLDRDGSQPVKMQYWWAVAAGLVGATLWYMLSPQHRDELNGADKVVIEAVQDDGNVLPVEVQQHPVVVVEPEGVARVEPLSKQVVSDDGKVEKMTEAIVGVPQTNIDKVPETEWSKADESIAIDAAIDRKVEEVFAQVAALEVDEKTITDAEIDSLLIAAQRQLLSEGAFEVNGKIDAMALLDEVELELYDDQRNPLFLRLKEGFFKLRTAVADRNK